MADNKIESGPLNADRPLPPIPPILIDEIEEHTSQSKLVLANKRPMVADDEDVGLHRRCFALITPNGDKYFILASSEPPPTNANNELVNKLKRRIRNLTQRVTTLETALATLLP